VTTSPAAAPLARPDNVRLALLADIEDIVARHGMDGDDRRGGIHREICRHGRAVARFVAHVNRQGVITLVSACTSFTSSVTDQVPSLPTVAL
jgi:hypothetical protein